MILRKRIITGLAITALTSAAIVGGIGVPSLLSVKTLQGEINDAQAAINERVAIFRYLRKAAADLEDTKQRMGNLSRVAVQEGHELEFIKAMEGVAEAAGVKQEISLDMVNRQDVSSWERLVPLRLTITGSYPAVRDYLVRVERLPYLVNVRSFTLGSNASGRDSDRQNRQSSITASLSATVYWIGAGGPAFTRLKP